MSKVKVTRQISDLDGPSSHTCLGRGYIVASSRTARFNFSAINECCEVTFCIIWHRKFTSASPYTCFDVLVLLRLPVEVGGNWSSTQQICTVRGWTRSRRAGNLYCLLPDWKYDFYRATLWLCVSAVFAVARCLSVRPSRRRKLSTNFFRSTVAHHSSFFDPSTGIQFQGEPLQRGRKIEGVGKFCDFRLKSPYISETVQDRSMVITMER